MAAPYGRYQKYLTDDTGDIVASATVTVTDKSTGGLATLYSTRTGTGITNPTTSSVTGLIEFYVDNGRYDIAAVSGAFTSTDTDKEINTEAVAVNKQSYTATYSANILTVTPEINSTVFATEQSGLIIRVILPAMTTTGLLQVNYDGSVRDVHWIDDSVTASGDIDSTYNKELLLRDNGTDWLIISDVSGSNSDGNWEKKANGWANVTIGYEHDTEMDEVAGNIFGNTADIPAIDLPITFSVAPTAAMSASTTGANGNFWIASTGVGSQTTTTQLDDIRILDATSDGASRTYIIHIIASGRWY